MAALAQVLRRLARTRGHDPPSKIGNCAPTAAAPPPRSAGTPRKPREGTKQEAVLTLLRRTEVATIAQIMETTARASHTVCGSLAGLKKKGIKIDTLEKVRMVGAGKEGAKGSYTIYQLAA